MRTDLDQPWLDSIAYALVHYEGVGDINSLATLLLIFGEAAKQTDAHAKEAVGDLADGVARLVRDASPQQRTALEFRNLDTDEVVDPSLFQDTEEGRAGVWAARVLNAAVSGDVEGGRAVVAALIDDETITSGALGLPLQTLIGGAAMILHEQSTRDHWAALNSWSKGNPPPAWFFECYGGSHLGLTPGWQDFPCRYDTFSSPLDRDREAARHVLTHRHAITWGQL